MLTVTHRVAVAFAGVVLSVALNVPPFERLITKPSRLYVKAFDVEVVVAVNLSPFVKPAL
ncbi:hypothetical protein TK49_08290 [Ralstonia mannitolilytica]|nr:hypothetical protein TK49_08290 [Ralstonia mannitolilytica]